MTQIPDSVSISSDIELIHRFAGNGGGRIILASFGQNPITGTNLSPKIEAFAVGETIRMTARATALAAEQHRNVYVMLATMRADLAPGKKGGENDIEAVFGIVADFDAREDARAHEWAARLPMQPTMVLETSSLPEPSFQCRFVFDAPVSRATAKRLARALQCKRCCQVTAAAKFQGMS